MADSATKDLWDNLRLGYTESPGHPLLRREIANLYKSIYPDDVLVLAPEEGIYVALNVLLKRGDHAIILTPAYQSLIEVASSTGADVTSWPLETDGIKWRIDLPLLERSIRNSTKLIVINFPHNPTGFHPDKRTFDAIISLARTKRIPVFSDEMYRFSERTADDRFPSVADIYEGGITLGGLSKSFGLPGLRIGWLTTKNHETMSKFVQLKDYTTICNSAPSEILAVIALRGRDRILNRIQDIMKRNLDIAERVFATHHSSIEWIPPVAGPVAFPRLRLPEPIDRFCERLVEAKGVMAVPGTLFDFPGKHFRVGLGRADFPRALEHFGDFLDEYRRTETPSAPSS